ncbi:MAG: hypothetical protein HYT46_02715 [Candidatus Vogelbacteria bacterium]|nr:hypothetical protein [Candidatus Vogelbacteria bacterium]
MPEITEARRAEARRAMEGEVWQKKRAVAAEILGRRRTEAQLAMEGNEHRLKRQAAETANREAAAAVAAARRAEEEKQGAERQAAQSAVAAERERAAQAAAEADTRRRKAQTTSQTIDRLKTSPLEMSPIRTLKTDLAEAAAAGATLTQAIIREQGQKPILGANVNGSKSRRPWLALLALTLFLAGGATLIYIYFYYWSQPPLAPGDRPIGAISDPDEQLFLLTDERVEIEIQNQGREILTVKFRQTLNDGAVSVGRVTRLVPMAAGRPLALKPWLEALSISLPEKLIQSLEPKFLLGRYDDSDRPNGFLLLKTKSYETSFSALRQDEKSLINLFYQLTGRVALAPAATTSIFADRLINNLETRQVRQDGKAVLLYGFLDQSTIAIAENENTLGEILNRRRAIR